MVCLGLPVKAILHSSLHSASAHSENRVRVQGGSGFGDARLSVAGPGRSRWLVVHSGQELVTLAALDVQDPRTCENLTSTEPQD